MFDQVFDEVRRVRLMPKPLSKHIREALGLLTLTILLPAAFADALPLSPIPDAPQDRLPISKDTPELYPCGDIVAKLEAYDKMARPYDQSITAFLEQVVERILAWHQTLEPLENTTQTIPAGAFYEIKNGADQMRFLTDRAYENSELLAIEMARILDSLKQCVIK